VIVTKLVNAAESRRGVRAVAIGVTSKHPAYRAELGRHQSHRSILRPEPDLANQDSGGSRSAAAAHRPSPAADSQKREIRRAARRPPTRRSRS
jgi:hypothetical protein